MGANFFTVVKGGQRHVVPMRSLIHAVDTPERRLVLVVRHRVIYKGSVAVGLSIPI